MADLLTLINAVPDAQDGNIISSDYHNTIKAALQAIAAQLGSAAGPETVSVTVQPSFSTVGGANGTPWGVDLGVATSAPRADGFIPLSLPDGAIIQKLIVIGAQTNPVVGGYANLLILQLGGTGSTTLIQIDLSTGGIPFTLSGTPGIPGLSASALANMQTVQNSQFKYALQATASGSGITINAFQLVYTTS